MRIVSVALLSGIGSLWALTYLFGQTQAPAVVVPSATESISRMQILLTVIFGFLSLVATNVFSLINANRQRRWDLQDRADARHVAELRADQLRGDLSIKTEMLRVENIQTAVELAKVLKISRERLIAEILENTNITLETREHLTHLLTTTAAAAEVNKPTLADIAAVGADTNKKVRELIEEKKDV